MPSSPFSPTYDLVTGGTRGAGRETVLELVQRGRRVIFLYRSKDDRAQELIGKAKELNPEVEVVAVKCDITNPEQLKLVSAEINRRKGYFGSLFLVASGGLERGMPEDYPMQVNRDAQLAVVKECWNYLRFGATIVFDTSHWAHLVEVPGVQQLPNYLPIALSKKAGEKALMELIPELEAGCRRNVRFIIVSGDMLVDSMVVRLMERINPGIIAARLAVAGVEALPTYATFGRANVDSMLNPNIAHNWVVVVGGALETLLPA